MSCHVTFIACEHNTGTFRHDLDSLDGMHCRHLDDNADARPVAHSFPHRFSDTDSNHITIIANDVTYIVTDYVSHRFTHNIALNVANDVAHFVTNHIVTYTINFQPNRIAIECSHGCTLGSSDSVTNYITDGRAIDIAIWFANRSAYGRAKLPTHNHTKHISNHFAISVTHNLSDHVTDDIAHIVTVYVSHCFTHIIAHNIANNVTNSLAHNLTNNILTNGVTNYVTNNIAYYIPNFYTIDVTNRIPDRESDSVAYHITNTIADSNVHLHRFARPRVVSSGGL